MTAESFDDSVKELFDRPGEQVAPDLAAHWMRHEDRKTIFDGEAQIIGIQTSAGMQYFSIEEVILFSHDSTMKRWGNSRGPEIARLNSGGIICYDSRGRKLTFSKTQGAENLMFSTLRQVDRLGAPLPGDENILTASKIATVAGLNHKSTGQLTPFYYRGRRALLLSVGGHRASEDEIQRLTREALHP